MADPIPRDNHVFEPEVQDRFRDLCIELVALVESGEIQRNPRHADYLRAQAAKCDTTLQAVLKRVSRKAPIRTGRKQAANGESHG
jgi:hypothetical protein